MAATKAAWGIEVGQFAVKAMRIVADGDTLTVTDFSVIQHQRVLTDPAVEDQAGMVRVSLATFVQQNAERLGTDPIVMSLPGSAGFARFTTLPGVDPKSIKSMVEYEAKQQIPFPMEDVEWDSHILPPDETGQCGIGIFAVTKDRLRELLSLYAECGIEPDVLTLSPISVYNALAHELALTPESPAVTCVDIGTASSDFIVLDRGRCWIRTFPVGGTHFTQSIADAFAKQGVNYGKAERIKLDRTPREEILRARTTAMRGVTAQLVDEIGRSRDFYQDGNHGVEIKSAFGVGSTLKISGLRTKIAGDLKLDVKRLESFSRLEVAGPDPAAFASHAINLLSAYGLALQGLGLARVEVNLAPIARVREKLWKAKTPWFAAAAALICLCAGSLFLRWTLDKGALGDLAERAADADAAISQGRNLVSQLEEVQRVADDFATANMISLLEDRSVWPHLVNDAYSALAAAKPAANELSGDPAKIRAIAAKDRNLVQLLGLSGKSKFDAATNKRQIEVAVRVLLSNGDPTRHINSEEGVLGWLRRNKDRPDVPYTIDEETLAVPNWTKIVAGKREESTSSSGSSGSSDGSAADGAPVTSGGSSGGASFGGGSFKGRKKLDGPAVPAPGQGGSLSGAGGESSDAPVGGGDPTSGDQTGSGGAKRKRVRTQVAGTDEKLPTLELAKDAPLPKFPVLIEERDAQYEGVLVFTVTLRSPASAVSSADSAEQAQ
jgi:type IV pilus assembly protein PilM